MTQFYVPQLQPGTKSVVITSFEFRHIIKSYRAKEGDIIQLFNGNGWIFEARVDKIFKDKVEVTILKETFFDKKNFEIILCQSLIKLDKFELVIEKATEIGVDEIIPVLTTRTLVQVEKFTKKYERFKKICIESAKQSHRCYLPKITEPKKLYELFTDRNSVLNIVCWKDARLKLINFKDLIKKYNKIKIFIGPEGDFTNEEIEFFNNQENTIFVTLTDTILRSETAAVVSSALVMEYKSETE